jgi:hypothetical protein
MPDPVSATVAAVSNVGSAAIGARGAKKAAQAQERASQKAQDTQREIFERQTELAEPFRQAGITSQNELMRLLGIGGDASAADYGMLTRGYRPEDLQIDPGYAVRLSESHKALERSAAARGGLLSGSILRGTLDRSQTLASQEYQNAFNRAQAQLGNRLGALGSLYGAGQTATQQVADQAGQYGANVGNLMMQSGQARASGYLGQANALSNALGQAAGAYGLYRGGYFGSPSGGGGSNLQAYNYMGPRYGGMV